MRRHWGPTRRGQWKSPGGDEGGLRIQPESSCRPKPRSESSASCQQHYIGSNHGRRCRIVVTVLCIEIGFVLFFRSPRQPTTLNIQRWTSLWLSWGTGTFWMPNRSVSLKEQSTFLTKGCGMIEMKRAPPQVLGETMQVKLYAPPQSKIDPSIAVMLLIAIVTVTLGGWWSRACERWAASPHGRAWRERLRRSFCLIRASLWLTCWSVCIRDRLEGVLDSRGDSKGESGDLFLYSPLKVIFFVGLMSGMLLLMYFFYNVLGKWE